MSKYLVCDTTAQSCVKRRSRVHRDRKPEPKAQAVGTRSREAPTSLPKAHPFRLPIQLELTNV